MNTLNRSDSPPLPTASIPSRRWFDSVSRTALLEIFAIGLLLETLSLSIPIFSQFLFDTVVARRETGLFKTLVLAISVSVVFESLMLYYHIMQTHRVGDIVHKTVARPVLLKLLELPLRYFETLPRGEIATHVREIAHIRNFLSWTWMSGIVDLIAVSLALGVMAWNSPVLAVVAASSLPVLMLLSVYLRKLVHINYDKQRAATNSLEATIAEGINQMSTIKTMALEDNWFGRWMSATDTSLTAASAVIKLKALETGVLRGFHRLLVVALLAVGANELLGGRLTPGKLVACYMLGIYLIAPTTRIFNVGLSFYQYQRANSYLADLLLRKVEQDTEVPQRAYARDPIVFDHVFARYADDLPYVLRDLNFTLLPGTSAGIVGGTGSGKTTLSKLLQRHLVPERGHLYIGGAEVRELDVRVLRRKVTLLTHDAAIFAGTLVGNIVGDYPLDEKWLRHCYRVAALDSVIDALPLGMRTPVDSGAPQLSSGQRQQVALARALYARPVVLVIDEATNALDTSTERVVLRNLLHEFSDRFLIVITHRSHLLSEFSCIAELCDGQLVMYQSDR